MENLLRRFKLYDEKEQPELVYEAISKGVPFRGTNLWILIFAIFIASLGLNVNSTAVIIGAMLISPLMGPIVGIGYSAAINDSSLLRKSLTNYVFALAVGFLASALYFLLTPIHEAQSELLSRTQPTLYDVLIATFGGFAGVLAACSRQKGNVVPGVAIATALMPPLCTAGYGLAALNWQYLFGALYLFLINSVFIAVATFVTVRYLRYPYKEFLDQKEKKRSQAIIVAVVLLTAIPSVYFAYDIVQKNNFDKSANKFIEAEGQLPDNVLLKKETDNAKRIITLSYIGKEITDSTINVMKRRMKNYDIGAGKLVVNQGLSYLNKKEEILVDDNMIDVDKSVLQSMQLRIDSFESAEKLASGLYGEIKALYPSLKSAFIQPANYFNDSVTDNNRFLVYLKVGESFNQDKRERLISFLETRLGNKEVDLVVER